MPFLAAAQTYPVYDPYYGLPGRACGTLTGPGQAPVSTTCSSGCTISAGVATVTPASMANIAVGQPLLVDRTGTAEYVVPRAVTGSAFTATFTRSHTGTFLIENTFPNTTESTGTGTFGPGTVTITPVSMAGIVPGVELDIDPNQPPATVTGETLTPYPPGSTAGTKVSVTLAHASVLPNTLTILDNGVQVATSSLGFIGPSSASIQAVYNHDTPYLFSTAERVVFTPAKTGDTYTANYTYLPSEVVSVTSTTATNFTVTLKNQHAGGFRILGAYFTLTQTGQHWMMCDPLNNVFYYAGMTSSAPSTNDVTNFPSGNLPINTTLAVASTGGSTTVFTPVSMTGIVAGAPLELECDTGSCTTANNPNWERLFVSSVTPTTFTAYLANGSPGALNHNIGATIKCCRNDEVMASKYDPNKNTSNQSYTPFVIGRMRRAGWNAAAYSFNPAAMAPDYGTQGASVYNDMPTESWIGSGASISTNTQKVANCFWVMGGVNAPINGKGFGNDAINDLITAMPPRTVTVSSGQISSTFGSSMPDLYSPNLYSWIYGAFLSEYKSLNTPLYTEAPWNACIIQDESDEWGSLLAGAGEDFATVPSARNSAFGVLGVLESSPLIAANDKTSHHAQNYSQNALNQTKDALRSFLTAEYGTIGALNKAWGSSFSVFGSSGKCIGYSYSWCGSTVAAETVGTGNGSQTTFNYTLADAGAIDKHSVQILASVSGGPSNVVIAGDLPGYSGSGGSFSGTGTFQEQGTVSSVTCSDISCNIPSPGTYAVKPTSMTNIMPGDLLTVDTGAQQEIVEVSAVTTSGAGTTVKFTATFTKIHSNTPSPGWAVVSTFDASVDSINYSTKAISLTFTTAPPSGVTLTVNYMTGGWNNLGSGLMDTDDSACSTWMGIGVLGTGSTCDAIYFNNSPNGPAGAKAGDGNLTFQADLDAFLKQCEGEYGQNFAIAAHRVYPHIMIQSQYGANAWGTPARPEVDDGMNPWVDFWGGAVASPSLPGGTDIATARPELTSNYPALIGKNRLQYIQTLTAGKPILYQIEFNGGFSDSPLFNLASTGVPPNWVTQPAKGAAIAGAISDYFNTVYYGTETPGLGLIHWDAFERKGTDNCGGCGWFTWNDNQFDGIQNTTNPGSDILGSQTFTLIPEMTWPGGNGNSSTPIKNAIIGVQNTLAGSVGQSIGQRSKTTGGIIRGSTVVK
jgi:hypothetical protein